MAIDKALSLSVSLEKIWTEGDLKQKQKLQNLVFPSGLGYEKSKDRVRTPKVNAIFGSIPILTKEISNIKNGEPIPVNQFSDLVSPEGFELYTKDVYKLNLSNKDLRFLPVLKLGSKNQYYPLSHRLQSQSPLLLY